MSDGDNLDFRGLATEAQQAFRPHYADVVRRAGRRRNKARAAGAAAIAVGVAAGGGTAVSVLDREGPPGPVPSATPGSPLPGGTRLPAPQPKYTEIGPGAYDVTKPDVPLTGMWTELRAGDLDHLYLEYQDCAAGACTRMLAATADRGRTWNALRMPIGLITDPKYASIMAVRGTTLVARDNVLVKPDRRPEYQVPRETYWTSADGGATWRQPAVRQVDALPAGWPVWKETFSLAAFDPATGDIARLTGLPQWAQFTGAQLRAPVTEGIWMSAMARGRRVVMVSEDGGRTWEERTLPAALARDIESGFGGNEFATADGRTVYAIEKLRDKVRVHVSTDGARTWRAGAVVDLDGPLLSMLPTADGALLLEGTTATYRSTDQARTFTKAGPSRGSRAYAIPGGYAIPTNNNEVSVWLSPDGVNWSYVARPDVP